LSASDLATGTVPIAVLGVSGTKDNTTFLRGDNVWAVPGGGGGTVSLSAQTVAGNPTGVTAPAVSMSVAQILDMMGTTQGAIVARTSGWIAMSPGASGTFLKSNGSGANLSWAGLTYADLGNPTMFNFGAGAVGAPSVSVRSGGTKLVLYDQLSASLVDYAIGVEASYVWFSTPSTATGFRWYAGTTGWMTLNSAGLALGVPLNLSASFTTTSSVMVTNLNAQYLGGIQSSGFLTPSSNLDAAKLVTNTISTSMMTASLDNYGNSRGSILFRGNSGWAVLTPGTSGMFLKTNGPSADPVWATPPTGSGYPASEFYDYASGTVSTAGAVVVYTNSSHNHYHVIAYANDVSSSGWAVMDYVIYVSPNLTAGGYTGSSQSGGSGAPTLGIASTSSGTLSISVTKGTNNASWKVVVRAY